MVSKQLPNLPFCVLYCSTIVRAFNATYHIISVESRIPVRPEQAFKRLAKMPPFRKHSLTGLLAWVATKVDRRDRVKALKREHRDAWVRAQASN